LLVGLVVPHVWVGVGLAYACVANLLNSTTITSRFGRLTVKVGPLPWRGNRAFDANDLSQLFVVERRGNRGATTFDVCAVTRDGRRQQLVKPAPTRPGRLRRATPGAGAGRGRPPRRGRVPSALNTWSCGSTVETPALGALRKLPTPSEK
jgi:hypothetical protein